MDWQTLVIGGVYLLFHRPINQWFEEWAGRLVNGKGDAVRTNCECDDCRLSNGDPPCPHPECERAIHGGPHRRFDVAKGMIYWEDPT